MPYVLRLRERCEHGAHAAEDEVAAGSSKGFSESAADFFPAVLAVAVTAWQLGCRGNILEPLLNQHHYPNMDLASALDSLSKVCSHLLLSCSGSPAC